MQSHSAVLRDKIDLMSGPRLAAGDALWSHNRLTELMPWVLMRTYTISNASVPLMRAALKRCELLGPEDPVAVGLAAYLREHIPEEIGHDDQFLEDLEALGCAREDVLARLPWPSLAALIGMQYYWIHHRHPIAFVGYAAVIEGKPVPEEKVYAIQRETSLPEAGFRTLLWHSKHDADHTAELDRALDALPLTKDQTSLLGVNVAHTHHLLAQSVHEMLAAFDQHISSAA